MRVDANPEPIRLEQFGRTADSTQDWDNLEFLRQYAWMAGIRKRKSSPSGGLPWSTGVDDPELDFELNNPRLLDELGLYEAWLQTPPGTPAPDFLLRRLAGYHQNNRPKKHANVLVLDGGGVRLAAFAAEVALGLRECPDMIIASSAGTYFAEQLLRSTSPQDIAEALKTIANVPYDHFADQKPEYFNPFKHVPYLKDWEGFPAISANLLEKWDTRRTKGAMVNDYLFDDAYERPPGLEGFRHRLQVTVSVAIIDKSHVARLGLDDLEPGESREFHFWKGVDADYRRFGGAASMRQYLFPRDLFSHDPKNPHALGPLGVLLRAEIGGDDDVAVMKWLNTQLQSRWNANSSRNGLLIDALGVMTHEGHVVALSDGQMLGQPPLVKPHDKTLKTFITAARTMRVDWRHVFARRPFVHEVDLSGDKTAAMNFSGFARSAAHRMSRLGLERAMKRQAELQRAFNVGEDLSVVEAAPTDAPLASYPMLERTTEKFWRIIRCNIPGMMEMMPVPEVSSLKGMASGVAQRTWQAVADRLRVGGPDAIGKDSADPTPAFEPALN